MVILFSAPVGIFGNKSNIVCYCVTYREKILKRGTENSKKREMKMEKREQLMGQQTQ
jgi:hypothetical protein